MIDLWEILCPQCQAKLPLWNFCCPNCLWIISIDGKYKYTITEPVWE
jgi:predicted amidophosphoribosyltransferase